MKIYQDYRALEPKKFSIYYIFFHMRSVDSGILPDRTQSWSMERSSVAPRSFAT